MALRIVDLHEVSPADTGIFGGKACGLARLIAAGARVPRGFAVEATTTLAADWAVATRDDFRRRVEALLCNGRLAVRSSAVGEDAADRSFAGMFETVLGVTDSEQAMAAATHCIESARSERVRTYLAGTPLPPVGLVVQSLVDAGAAGVCFTVDPAGKDHGLVIEGVAGCGDQLVSGRTQPQRWRIYRSGLGHWDVRAEAPPGTAPVLADGVPVRIAEQALAHAERFGHPLDLEWAVDYSGQLWWLQARPITTASAPPRYDIERAFDGVDDGPVSVWLNWNVRETMPDPLTPLSWSVWRDVIIPTLVGQVFGTPQDSPVFRHVLCLDRVNGRIYFNMNGVLAWPVVSTLMMSRLMRMVDPLGAEVCARLRDEGVLQPRRLPVSQGRLLADMLRASGVQLRRVIKALKPRQAMAAMRGFERMMAERGRQFPLASLSDQELRRERWSRKSADSCAMPRLSHANSASRPFSGSPALDRHCVTEKSSRSTATRVRSRERVQSHS